LRDLTQSERIIKFRAWDKVNKHIISWKDFQELDYPFTLFAHIEDYQWELMQYTGLKDKNGKEIYEGDIVRQGETITSIIWESPGFIMEKPTLVSEKIKPIEIIGNIYENPELLKEEKIAKKKEGSGN
jgi:hypothetical protein